MQKNSYVHVDALLKHVKAKNYFLLRRQLSLSEDADVAEVFESVANAQIVLTAFRLVSPKRRPEVFSHLSRELRSALLDNLPKAILSDLLNAMEADDRTHLLEDLEPETRSHLLNILSPEERKLAWRLLSYPENSVGRIMDPEILKLRESFTVRDALDFIRWRGEALANESLSQLFVVDDNGYYLGDVSLGQLVMTDPPSQTLKKIMTMHHATLEAHDNKVKAVDAFRKYDRATLPVIDSSGVLVGIVTADDLFDVAEEEATEDILQFGGQASLEESYFATPLFKLWSKRAGWLVILFLGELLTGSALKHYDETIASMSFLIYFVPLIISSGGNSGTQAASLVIRGMAVREMQPSDWRRVLPREIVMGLGLGVLLGILGFIRSYTWEYGHLVSTVVLISLVGVVIFGAVLGSMLPFFLKGLGLDPAVSSSPFIASLVDLFGILIFVNVAILGIKYGHLFFGN